MRLGVLSDHVIGVAHKWLSSVEACRHRSNQHEFNGVKALRELLGSPRQRFNAQFLYLSEDLDQPITDEGFLTWYDAREGHPTRSEYRLYFPDTAVLERAEEGDLLLLALLRDRSVVAVIARGGSSYESQLLWLFGIDGGRADGFTVRADLADQRRDIDITARFVLDLLRSRPTLTE